VGFVSRKRFARAINVVVFPVPAAAVTRTTQPGFPGNGGGLIASNMACCSSESFMLFQLGKAAA